ncbi:MAG: GNAT family N-acetyltransferase [Gammaproteobacteria bacterium]|nr:GNAT family N-acetyltransferase [Gammaproteobacteria bacterium]
MKYKVKTTSWNESKNALSEIRRKVFIEEQNVPEELEWDEYDQDCTHVLVTDEHNKAVACGRLKSDGHIGRMAVLKEHRATGIGTAMLSELINHAENMKINKVYLHAQTSAIKFYEKQGFEVISEEFMDAGIAHKTMKKSLIA